MRLSFRRLSPLAALAFVASIFAVSCLSDPSGPSYQPGFLALAPSFESSASGIVDVDRIHVILIRNADESVALDTVITLTTNSDSVDLSLSVPISSSSEAFSLTLECLSPTGDVVFRAGPLSVTATTSGTGGVVATQVPVTYVGVGSNAADINVPGEDIFYLHMRDTLTLEALALDSLGATIAGTPIKWTSADTTIVRFPDPAVGRMVAGQIRGWVDVTAELLTGPTDIVEVYVEPVPNEISIFSGDNQTGLVGVELPVVLEIQVNAPDGPIDGLEIDFTTADGGAFAGGSLITDSDGYAWTRWTLGQGTGQQTATATVRAYPVLQTTFTASSVNPPATVSWTNIEGGYWSEPTNWSSGSVPGPLDTVEVTLAGAYTVWLDGDATVEVLTLSGAAGTPTLYITGNGTLTVNDAFVAGPQVTVQVLGTITGAGSISNNSSLFRLEGGTISTSGGFNTAGTLALLGGTFDGTVVTNAAGGGIDWSGGDIALANGAMLSNLEGGVFGANARGSITGSIPVHNWGVFEKDGPDSTIIQAGLENYATVNVGAGWLVVGGELWHMDGALLSGIGTLDLANATIVTFEGDIGPGQSPGILTVEGDLTLGANSTVYVEINGTTAGTDYDHLNVVGNLGLAGTLDITMGFTPSLGNSFGVLDYLTASGNFATITGLAIGGGLELDTIWETNSLVLDVVNAAQATGEVITWTGAGGDYLWNTSANWDLGRAPNSADSVLINLDASYTVGLETNVTVGWLVMGDAGNATTQILYVPQGGTLQVDSGATVTESGQIRLAGGSLVGSGDVFIRGNLFCESATLAGMGRTVAESGGTVAFSAGTGTNSVLDSRDIWNDGTLEWTGSNIVMNNSAQIVNNGSFTITADGAVTRGTGAIQPAIINNGTMLLTLTGTATSIGVPMTSTSTSSLQINSGILVFTGNTTFQDAMIEVGDGGSSAALSFAGGTNTIDAQSMVRMGPDGLVQVVAGSLWMSGSYDDTGDATSVTQIAGGTATFDNGSTAVIPNLLLGGGTLAGTGDILVADVMSWTAGRLEGTGVLEINTQSTMVVGGTGLELSERVVDNRGTVYVNGEGPAFSNAATVNNLSTGTIEFLGDFSMLGTGTINNDGVLTKSAATGTSTRIGPDVYNVGTLDVQGGTMAFEGSFTHSDGAILQGNGTIDLSNVTDVPAFDGDVNPGTSPGTLTFIGDAAPSALFTANIEIGGLTAGTEHDQVTVSGSFVANGTVNVSIINGFPPSVGNTFTVLTFTSRTGDFASYTGMDLGGGLLLEPQWNSTSLDLVVTQPPAAQILFAGDSAGGLSTGVFTVNPDGTGLTHPYSTTSVVYEEVYPKWSPNRERIAFTNRTGYSAPNPNELFMMYSTGDTLVTLVSDTSTFVPRWSPNGTHIAFECGDGWSAIDVCVIGDVTGALSTLGSIGNGGGKVYVTDFDPTNWNDGPWVFAWDPLNNDRIAVVRDSMPPLGGAGQSMIYTMLYNGTGVQRLVAAGVLDVGNGPLQINGNLDWSSDGQWLVFAAADPQGQQNIYRIDRTGANLTQLAGAADQDVGPKFSPNGTEILFGRNLSAGQFCDYDAWIMNSDGSSPRAITAEHICDWNLETLGADWSPDGQEIVITGFDQPYGTLAIFVVPRTITAANYFTNRVLVGRIGQASGEVHDIQPSWRP